MNTTEHRPVLIVIAGPNGSGKTTITSKILKHEWLEGAVYINPDNVAQERFGDIFETVLSSEGKVDFIRRAREAGYFIRLFFVSTNHPSINSSRIAKRVMKGGHDVPIPKIISRYQKSIVNCKRCAALADRVYVYDNSIDDTEARLLFRMTDGQLFKQYTDDIPEWALTILH